MQDDPSFKPGAPSVLIWRLLLLACSAVLFAMALSNGVYETTSPAFIPFHVLLRKAYSIVAFALLGYLALRSRLRWPASLPATVVALALYSAAIELGQYLTGVREGLLSNGIDILCGAIGGGVGALAARVRLRSGR